MCVCVCVCVCVCLHVCWDLPCITSYSSNTCTQIYTQTHSHLSVRARRWDYCNTDLHSDFFSSFVLSFLSSFTLLPLFTSWFTLLLLSPHWLWFCFSFFFLSLSILIPPLPPFLSSPRLTLFITLSPFLSSFLPLSVSFSVVSWPVFSSPSFFLPAALSVNCVSPASGSDRRKCFYFEICLLQFKYLVI